MVEQTKARPKDYHSGNYNTYDLFAKIKNCASIALCLMMIMKTKVRLHRRLF